jgi:tetratricopeptide (TPR) repeat protein
MSSVISPFLKYASITKTISSEKYYEPSCLKGIINYFMYMSSRNFDVDGINFNNLNIAETFCKNILKNYVSKSKDMEILHNRAEIYNALGLCALWRKNYDFAFKYFNNAKTDFETAKIYDTQPENIFCSYSMNLLVVHYNIALSSIKLREWQNGLDAIINYENLFANLSKEKQEYIVTRKNEISYQTNSLKGRCYHGLEQYEKAIISFTNAIKFENSAFYLYFYRGISYLGVNNSYLACKDFKYACDNGFKDGCNRYINCN